MQALEDLDYLAALDDDGNLSEVGIIMSELPLEPPLARALIAACEYDCVDELLTIAAMLTGSRQEAAAPAAPQPELTFDLCPCQLRPASWRWKPAGRRRRCCTGARSCTAREIT